MSLSKAVLLLGIIGSAIASALMSRETPPASPRDGPFQCNEVNVFFTYVSKTLSPPLCPSAYMKPSSGLPPYHPFVKEHGHDPAFVDAALREDAANIIKSGYNLRGSPVLLLMAETI